MVEIEGLFAIAATVLTVSALFAGVVARAPLSFPILFLALGLLLGDGATGAVEIDLDSEFLRAVAFATLALVLFLDAINLELAVIRHDWVAPALTLGPGAILVIALTAVAAMVVAGLDPLIAFIVGAILASTDPVVLRDILRDERIPRSVRNTLSIEGGTNDLIVLPPILILVAVATHETTGALSWLGFVGELLIIGPLAGAAVGWGGAWLMSAMDARHPVQREWQSLYGIGLVFAAFAAGEYLGEDGFLAAFAAGVAVSLSSKTLCDCFLDFGEVLAELLMLLSFVLFGAVLSGILGDVEMGEALMLGVLAVLFIRPLAVGGVLSLRHTNLSPQARAFIAWFGPRGLNSLLLALLVVDAGVAEGAEIFGIVGVVVLVSVAVHGVTATPLANWYARRVAAATLPEERESSLVGAFGGRFGTGPDEAPRITARELSELLGGPDPPLVLDVRSRSGFVRDPHRIPGSVRVAPGEVASWGREVEPGRVIVTYCTCQNEGTAARAALQLISLGHDARALKGGLDSWREVGEVEPLEAEAA
ncbi:MAG: cation:proton antiporter [Thermoleophilaceae bacterium]